MALIQCPECATSISDLAAACPKCGAPVPRNTTTPTGAVVTTQQTGKRFKAAELVGALMVAGGVVACTAQSTGAATFLLVVGLVVYLGARVGAWWSHG